jgi:hypothetical protein
MTSCSSGPLATSGDRWCPCATAAARTQRGPSSARRVELVDGRLVQSLSQPKPSSSASKSNGSGGLTEIGPFTYSGPFPEPPAQS